MDKRKGVICYIAEPHEMPVDQYGNRADLIMDGGAGVNRMNLGRFYEQYINASGRDTVSRLTAMFDLKYTDRDSLSVITQQHPMFVQAVAYVRGFYSIVSPMMVKWFDSISVDEMVTHLRNLAKEGMYVYFPTDNEPPYPQIVRDLERSGDAMYRSPRGPVTFKTPEGETIKTVEPVRIGSLYVIMLEKIGDDWTAVSSGKLQAFGVLSQVTNTDKYSQPTRQQAIRAWGEAEVRIYASYVDPHVTADILDRNNSPFTHKHMLVNILNADEPTNIWSVVDRNVQPLGGSKPVQLVKHILECGGSKFVYKPSGSNEYNTSLIMGEKQ